MNGRPRIQYIGYFGRWLAPTWSVTFNPGITLHFYSFARACQFAKGLQR